MSSQDKKRGDIVASSRSRDEKEKINTRLKSGAQAQKEFTRMIKNMFSVIDAQLNIEPKGIRLNASTLNNIIDKKNKKKLN